MRSNYLYWYRGSVPNFGDDLSPLLASLITERPVHYMRHGVPWIKTSKFLIGSIAHHARIPYSYDLCGAGCIDNTSRIVPPNRYYAVRGKYTLRRFSKFKAKSDIILGDPALLCRYFSKELVDSSTSRRDKFNVSLIPHYTDIPLVAGLDCSSVNVIDVRLNPRVVITEIVNSNYVISSSLHGLIVAQAFNIPALWIKIGNGVYGDQFKFQDFFSSLGVSDLERTDVNWGDKIIKYVGHQNTLCEGYRNEEDLLCSLKLALNN